VCLNEHLFRSLPAARQIIEKWIDYNTAKPHSSLCYQTLAAYPHELTAPTGATTGEALAGC
jgi:transposase InsO family protein